MASSRHWHSVLGTRDNHVPTHINRRTRLRRKPCRRNCDHHECTGLWRAHTLWYIKSADSDGDDLFRNAVLPSRSKGTATTSFCQWLGLRRRKQLVRIRGKCGGQILCSASTCHPAHEFAISLWQDTDIGRCVESVEERPRRLAFLVLMFDRAHVRSNHDLDTCPTAGVWLGVRHPRRDVKNRSYWHGFFKGAGIKVDEPRSSM